VPCKHRYFSARCPVYLYLNKPVPQFIPNKFHLPVATGAMSQEKVVLHKECNVIDIEATLAGKNARISF
jgi:hypothetical protein